MWMLVLFTLFYFLYVYFIVIFVKNKKTSVILALLPVTLLSGFRYDVGFDFQSYVLYFHQSQYDSEVYLDITFKIFSKIYGYVHANEQMLFLTYSFLSSYMTYKIISRIHSDYNTTNANVFFVIMILSFYSFYFFMTLNQIRSSLSALFISYAFIRRDKDLWCFVNLILSVLFHSAAIFLAPLLFIIDRVSIKVILLSFPVFAAFAYLNLFTDAVKFFLSFFNSRFIVYFDSKFFEPKEGLEKIYTLITTGIMFIVLNYAVKILDVSFYRVLKFCYLFLLLRLMSMDALIFARLSDFIKPLAIITITITICVFSKKIKPNIIPLSYTIIVLAIALLNVFLGSNISTDDNYEYGINFCVFGEICPL
ncbi:EpsG family protein [Pectobacterium carotovorum]